MYGKHFASTYTGSMCGAGADVFAVWGYVIANTRGSQVELNPAYLAAVLGMTSEQVTAAIDKLCSPDERSRSQLNEGRRLMREGQFAYHVPNHASYRRMRDEEERREYLRLKKQESRVRQRKETMSTDVNQGQPMSTHTEAEAEAYTEAKAKPTVASLPDWIPTDAWQGFVEMRKKIRAPLTERATRLTISKLEILKTEGNEPGAVLDQSTQNDWRGVFPLRTNGNGNEQSRQAIPERTKINKAALEGFREYEARRNSQPSDSDGGSDRRKTVSGGPDSVR